MSLSPLPLNDRSPVPEVGGCQFQLLFVMAELTSRDRLQPALLDRLSDDAPDVSYESRESRVISIRQLRNCVLRDLESLLNATRTLSEGSLEGLRFAMTSVINYGLPDWTGKALSSLDVRGMANELTETIRNFEPRIIAHSLRVTPLPVPGGAPRNFVAFLMEGDLWVQPYPERLYFTTELDLEAGEVRVREMNVGTS